MSYLAGDNGAPPPSTGNYEVGYCVDTSGVKDWRPLTINEHYQMLSLLRDEAARAAAEMCGNAAALMETTRQNVGGYGNALRVAWLSRAAEPFFAYVEGTNTSLYRWGQACSTNEARLYRLAEEIELAQTQMEALYASFKSEVAEIDKNDALWQDNFLGTDPGKEAMTEMVAEKTEQSRRIMQRLSDVFDGTVLEEAPRFQGPADARMPSEAEIAATMRGQVAAPQAPGAPGGGGAGARPSAPGAPPPAAPGSLAPQALAAFNPIGPRPVAPAVFQQPQAPAAFTPAAFTPTGPQLVAPTVPAPGSPSPQGAGLGPLPTAPGVPPVTAAVARAPLPEAPVIGPVGAVGAGAGGTSSPRGAPLVAPRIPGVATAAPRATMPAAPDVRSMSPPGSGLQGRNAPGAPSGAPPAGPGRGMSPQLPGRSGMPSRGPGSPGMPPGGRGMSTAPARPGMGTPGSPGSGMPPGGRPGGPGRGAPGAPSLPGRQAPRPSAARPGIGLPPGGPGMPRSLQGTRGTLGGPGASDPRGARTGHGPISPGSPGSTGSQGLRGRSGSVRAGSPENAQTTGAALRRGLDGRGMSTPTRGPAAPSAGGPLSRPTNGTGTDPARHREEERAAAAPPMVGDEELFAAKAPTPAVIEPSQEKVHAKRPGPALGRG